jgi:hypothetical protein
MQKCRRHAEAVFGTTDIVQRELRAVQGHLQLIKLRVVPVNRADSRVPSRLVNKQIKPRGRLYNWDVQTVTDMTVLRQQDLICLLPILVPSPLLQS